MNIRIGLLLLLLLSSLNPRLMANSMQTIQQVKHQHESRLLAIPGVVSVGIGLDENNKPIIIIGIEREDTALRASLPEQLDGYPVRVQPVGTPRAR